MRSSAQTSGASTPRRPESTDRYAPRQSTAPLRTGRSRQRDWTFPAKKPAAANRRKAGPAGRKPHPDTPPKPSDGVSNTCSDVCPTHMPAPTLPTSSIPPTSAAAPYRTPSANRSPAQSGNYRIHDHIHPQKKTTQIPTLTIRRPAPNTRKTMLLTDHRPHEEQTPESKHRKQTSALPDKNKRRNPSKGIPTFVFRHLGKVPRQRATEKRMRHWDGIASGRRLRLRSDGTSNAVPRRELPGKAISDTRISDFQRPGTRNANRPTPKISPSRRQRASTSRTALPPDGD